MSGKRRLRVENDNEIFKKTFVLEKRLRAHNVNENVKNTFIKYQRDYVKIALPAFSRFTKYIYISRAPPYPPTL